MVEPVRDFDFDLMRVLSYIFYHPLASKREIGANLGVEPWYLDAILLYARLKGLIYDEPN